MQIKNINYTVWHYAIWVDYLAKTGDTMAQVNSSLTIPRDVVSRQLTERLRSRDAASGDVMPTTIGNPGRTGPGRTEQVINVMNEYSNYTPSVLYDGRDYIWIGKYFSFLFWNCFLRAKRKEAIFLGVLYPNINERFADCVTDYCFSFWNTQKAAILD